MVSFRAKGMLPPSTKSRSLARRSLAARRFEARPWPMDRQLPGDQEGGAAPGRRGSGEEGDACLEVKTGS